MSFGTQLKVDSTLASYAFSFNLADSQDRKPVKVAQNSGRNIDSPPASPVTAEKPPYENYQVYSLMVPDAWHLKTPLAVETQPFIIKTVYSLYKAVQTQGLALCVVEKLSRKRRKKK